ncbi:polysaccharide deacetylase family protein [Nonomuraea sp. NPDC047897]|uniref:polysaccharide deacetylase family protein n=1 Tax=Nonomuraea sp. NPDC047897 TaxID=3364346 RepID=UPI003722A8E8
MPKSRFAGGCAVMVLTAAGCGLFPANPKPDVVVPANPTMIGYVDPSAVDGLVTMTMTEGEDAPRRVHISYPWLKDAPTLNEALRQEAERQLLDFRVAADTSRPASTGRPDAGGADSATNADGTGDADGVDSAGATSTEEVDSAGTASTEEVDSAGTASTEEVDSAGTASTDGTAEVDGIATAVGAGARPELNVDWQLVAASPDVIGVRLRTGRHLGVDWGKSSRTLWYDRSRGTVIGSAGLLSGRVTLEHLTRLVRDGLADRGTAVDRSRVTADADLFDSMAFNRNGDLVVEFDDCQVASCSLGRVAVAVPAERVVSWLSATGRRAQHSPRTVGRTFAPGVFDVSAEAGGPSAGGGGPTDFGGALTVPQADAPSATDPQAPAATDPQGVTDPQAPAATTPQAPGVTAPGSAERASEQVDCAVAKCVALTFDDGPGPDTPRLLDLLRERGARATFFTVGVNAAADPWLLGRMTAEGHEVGNHSWAHRDLTRLTTSKLIDTLDRTQDLITAHSGRRPTLARAPYGAVNEEVRDAARRLGLTLVGWDVNTVAPAETAGAATAGRPKAETIARRAVEGAHDGAVILLHDTSGAAVDAVPAIVEGLRGKGYALVTVGELYGDSGPGTELAEGSGKNATAGGP